MNWEERVEKVAKSNLPTISKLRKKADAIFSKAVRYRDGKVRGDGEWWSECITCGQWKPTKIMHAGHFQSRRYPATRWDYENVNAQCAGCNTFNYGEQYKYGIAIDLKYGTGTAKKLHNLAQQYFKVTRQYLEEVIRDAQTEVDFYLKKEQK